jgi:hypothetical protein
MYRVRVEIKKSSETYVGSTPDDKIRHSRRWHDRARYLLRRQELNAYSLSMFGNGDENWADVWTTPSTGFTGNKLRNLLPRFA